MIPHHLLPAECTPLLSAAAGVLRGPLTLLLRAHDYAAESGSDVWDFAVEIEGLSGVGLTATDLRWLLCKGYVAHATEVTKPPDPRRSFRLGGRSTFSDRTCVVLTPAGAALARGMVLGEAGPDRPTNAPTAHAPAASRSGPPHYDARLRELRFGSYLVKQFRQPSPNQEIVLTAFQEEEWSSRIDDPTPPQPQYCPQQRLLDTIKNLNRNQRNRLIRFEGDGTGRGIRWKPVSAESSNGGDGFVTAGPPSELTSPAVAKASPEDIGPRATNSSRHTGPATHLDAAKPQRAAGD